MIQIAEGSAITPAIAPMIVDAKMLTSLPATYNNIKTAIKKRRAIIVLKRLTNPFFSSTFHLLLYVANTVKAVGKAIAVKRIAIANIIDCNVPELIIAPPHASAVIKTHGMAKLLKEWAELSYFTTDVLRSL